MSNDQQLRYSEIFFSLQGEGRYVGIPSVFLRTFGCNFECHGFGQSRDQAKRLAPEAMPHHTMSLAGIQVLDDVEVPAVGCDSSASWSARFKHLSRLEPVESVAQHLLKSSASHDWVLATGQRAHLVITGGEPLLGWQPALARMLEHSALAGLKHVTFETNGTQLLSPRLREVLLARDFEVTWSVSPKLSLSGESWDAAIRPQVLNSYQDLLGSFLALKFVVEVEEDVEEAERAILQYRQAGVLPAALYVMPVGGSAETYATNRVSVGAWAVKRGWSFSPRLHVDLFGNRYGT